jgi:hypothetical protein
LLLLLCDRIGGVDRGKFVRLVVRLLSLVVAENCVDFSGSLAAGTVLEMSTAANGNMSPTSALEGGALGRRRFGATGQHSPEMRAAYTTTGQFRCGAREAPFRLDAPLIGRLLHAIRRRRAMTITETGTTTMVPASSTIDFLN